MLPLFAKYGIPFDILIILGSFHQSHNMDWRRYHRLKDIYDYLYHLQRFYPHLVQVIDIGKTVQRRPMLVVKIGTQHVSSKPAIFIEGGKIYV